MKTAEQIKALLFESESDSLDFKKEQYHFEGADDKSKSELLKDILAFANAWRRTDAFILIGAYEIEPGNVKLETILNHIDDAKIQQFVNSKTQKPIIFSYFTVDIDGKRIGVIQIPCQERPFFLKKNYGVLDKGKVYVRRGSSTAEADPDEIARMGEARLQRENEVPGLEVSFTSNEEQKCLGNTLTLELVKLELPPEDSIEDFTYSMIDQDGHLNFGPAIAANRDYWREYHEYIFAKKILHPVRFSIRNLGEVTGKKLKVRLRPNTQESELFFLSEFEFPSEPEASALSRLPPFQPTHTDVTIHKEEDASSIEINFGDVLAGDTQCCSDSIYFGAKRSGEYSLNGLIFGENIPSPIGFTLNIIIEVRVRSVSDSEFYDQTLDSD